MYNNCMIIKKSCFIFQLHLIKKKFKKIIFCAKRKKIIKIT